MRARDLLEDEAVVEERARKDAAGRVGEGRDGADAGGHGRDLRLVEDEAVEKGAGGRGETKRRFL